MMYTIFIVIKPYVEFSCQVDGGGVIPEETTPIKIVTFQHRIKVIRLRGLCIDLQWCFGPMGQVVSNDGSTNKSIILHISCRMKNKVVQPSLKQDSEIVHTSVQVLYGSVHLSDCVFAV